ncbi:HAD family hydrolase [Nocardia sp. NPDC051832]|uniref:HAD family hydrolase n=1 Tax=Nocardia sp. NPDC051832 TaxID=3155673 RepID=UPI00343C9C1F
MSRALRERGVHTVLWDLDGTLIGLRQRTFRVLMPVVAAAAFRDVVPPVRFLRALHGVLERVRANDSEETNHEQIVRLLGEVTGLDRPTADARFRALAHKQFPRLRRCFHPLPPARAVVADLTRAGVRQVVATNPLWPLETVTTRLRWGGFEPGTFIHITSGETMRRSKPRPEFYTELLEQIGAAPSECVMIGNDAIKDGPAATLGIPVFLLDPGRKHAAVSVGGSAGGDGSGVTGAGITAGDWAELAVWLGVGGAACSLS